MKLLILILIFLPNIYGVSLADTDEKNCTESVKIDYETIYNTMAYPKWMFEFDISGYITTFGTVDTNGYMHDIIVVDSYCDEFNDVAIKALSTVKHKPAKRDCKTVSQKVIARVWIATKLYSRLPKVDLVMSNYNELKSSKSGNAVGRFYYQRGMQFFRMGEDSLAQLDYFQAIAELGVEDLPYFDEAIYEEIKHILPNDFQNIDSLEIRASLLSRFYLFAKSNACYDSLILLNHKNSSAVSLYKYYQAAAYGHLKYYEDAINGCLEYLSSNPNDTSVLVNLGWNYYLSGKYDSCLFYSKKVVDMNPYLMTSHFNYALVHLRLGKVEEAVNLYKEAIITSIKRKYQMDGAIEDILDLIKAKIQVEVSKDLLINYFNIKEKALRKLLKL
ncbi:MAG: tetratricopeptide repeat protein [Ignavibacteria bacterium]|nr:tetratricopeptide repeat protein [Ignavibacteria bacterium]